VFVANGLFAQGGWLPGILNGLILFISILLIVVVLIQRGKGGGLAGAFGGAGGSSAFGSRAGDQFTRFTIVLAAIWILLIMLMVKVMPPPPGSAQPAVQPGKQGRLLPADESIRADS
jgi:preprotein translocase subunit SecG